MTGGERIERVVGAIRQVLVETLAILRDGGAKPSNNGDRA